GSELGGSGGLVGSWLGQLSNDVNLLPINYINRRLVNIHTKKKSWDVIQKEYAMSALGSKCKDVILHLWKTHKLNDLSETLQDRLKNEKALCQTEFFTETCTKLNGSFVCEDAQIRAVSLAPFLVFLSRLVWHIFMLFLGSIYNFDELKNPHARHNNVTIILDDKLVQVFGP
ncbi:hypothetical protein IGI04_025662, partial [Brassica rapa subsp. trilocularis]